MMIVTIGLWLMMRTLLRLGQIPAVTRGPGCASSGPSSSQRQGRLSSSSVAVIGARGVNLLMTRTKLGSQRAMLDRGLRQCLGSDASGVVTIVAGRRV